MSRTRTAPRSPEQIQRKFYTATAASYDRRHVDEDDEHHVALDFISALIDGYGYQSVLELIAEMTRVARRAVFLSDTNPTVPARKSLGHPLLSASHGLLCALQDG